MNGEQFRGTIISARGRLHKALIAILFLGLGIVSIARSQDHGLGLGIIIGEPTGISGKFWLNDINALDFGVGWALGGYGIDTYDANVNNSARFHAHLDYVWHDFSVIRSSERFPVYYGFGMRLNSGAGYNSSIGIRGVGGFAWLSKTIPIDLFIEVAPVLQLNPSTRIGLNAGFGMHYFLSQ